MTIKTKKTEVGLEYFTIFEVKAVTLEKERIVVDRYYNEQEANKYKDFLYEHCGNLYTSVYVLEQIVWVK